MLIGWTGSAVGFRLDSLLKLSDTRARNNKMTLMHYLCKVCTWQWGSAINIYCCVLKFLSFWCGEYLKIIQSWLDFNSFWWIVPLVMHSNMVVIILLLISAVRIIYSCTNLSLAPVVSHNFLWSKLFCYILSRSTVKYFKMI